MNSRFQSSGLGIPQAKNSQNSVCNTLLEELAIFSWISAQVLISNYNSKDATVLESDGKEMEGVLFQGRHLLDIMALIWGRCLLQHERAFNEICIINNWLIFLWNSSSCTHLRNFLDWMTVWYQPCRCFIAFWTCAVNSIPDICIEETRSVASLHSPIYIYISQKTHM